MDDYRFHLRRRARGAHCLVATGLCGCGHRTPPPKAYKTRMIRRALEEEFRRELQRQEDARLWFDLYGAARTAK